MVFTCLSVNPLDLGYMGEVVMCSMCCCVLNLVRSSDEKGVCCQ